MKVISESQRTIIAQLYELGYTMKDVAMTAKVATVSVQKIVLESGGTVRAKNNKSKPEEDIKDAYERLRKEYVPPVNDEPINCNTKDAKYCIYRSRTLSVNKCDYCLKVGKMRGGSPEECYKYAF